MSEQYLRVDDLAVGYDEHILIREICMDMKRGEILALIGPNGAGKSTILKTLTKRLGMLGGVVEIDGKSLNKTDARSLARRMAVVLTDRLKPELMTCRDIVSTGRYPYTGRLGILSEADKTKVEEALGAVHAEEIADCDFNCISDGQRQRILLARAICQEPEMIVLDEPTSFLDIRHKLELLSLLRHMAKQKGIAVILSLHEIDLAQKLADRILCVKGDTIYRYGTPEEVFTDERIRDLYGIEKGSFDTLFGSVELEATRGEPKVFVLSSGGTGIPVYRALQKADLPFAAGILYTNDMDYRAAKHLAAEVIEEQAFCPLGEENLARALEKVHVCDLVIDAGLTIGPLNREMTRVLEAAEREKKLIRGQSAILEAIRLKSQI